jgi:probable HAF family extracellular repeat protein
VKLSILIRLFISFGITLAASAQMASSDTVAFTIKNLGSLGGNLDVVCGINASGQVVGEASMAAGEMHAFLYDGDKMRDLGTLAGYASSHANDINATGQIVGWVSTALDQRRAFIYSGGRMREIGTLGGKSSAAYAINAAGEIVGEAETGSGQRHAFLYRGGHMQDLGTLGGNWSCAYALNDARQVVGVSVVGEFEKFRKVPFLYKSGKMVALDTSTHQSSQATAINLAGQIVGFLGDITPWSSDHAFLYSNGKLQDIGTFGGHAPFSEARAMNAHGQIVGISGSHPLDNSSLDGERAFLYSGGHMQDLRQLVGEANLAAAGFKALLGANGINDRGQIAGTGTDVKGNQIAFLLTPIRKK